MSYYYSNEPKGSFFLPMVLPATWGPGSSLPLPAEGLCVTCEARAFGGRGAEGQAERKGNTQLRH